ncbi:hypothetical protein ElyMa_002939500 [Elysia marginata]|uniref:Reverse transcriptase domain-containing protein n=1 Tax=Elysia marginata TaxID=1093978 RepID=A0AAV4I6E9_9GAST|nr:hypothetical protein ElyMa_002939500 [Elysia marginata]
MGTLHDHHTFIFTGGRPVCKLHFTDNIDLIRASNNELQSMTNRLVIITSAYGMNVSKEKSKVMVKNLINTSSNINVNGEPLKEVTNLKYCGAAQSKVGSCVRTEFRA